jgi:hypothetical protein
MGVNLGLKKFLAIFMVLLIISMTPVYAFSSGIYGRAQLKDHVAADEEFYAEITGIDGQIYVNVSNQLSDCICDDNYNLCTCYFSEQHIPGVKSINIVEDDEGNQIPHIINYKLDANAPEIEFNTILNGQTLIINYVVSDSSGSPDFPCSGIYSIEVFVNQQLEHTEIINTGIETCTEEGTISFEVEPDPLLDISVRVLDGVWNSNEEFNGEGISMDAYAPVAVGTFEIYQANNVLDQIALNNQEVPIVDIVFYVDEEELVSARGDLMDFNNIPTQNLGYDNLDAICHLDNEINLYECRFRNIKLRPESELIELPLTLIDAQGNQNSQTLTRTYQVISSSNEVTHIGPSLITNCDEDRVCFVGSHTLLRVEISGSEDSSFTQMHVPLRVSQISDSDIANPFKCELEYSNWVCYYTVQASQAFAGRKKEIYVDNSASDDYGKRLTGLNKEPVFIDLTPPTIKEGSIVKLVNNLEVEDYCLTATDSMTLQLEADDDLSTELWITASSSATIDGAVSNKCVNSGSKFSCSIDITNFIPAKEDDKKIIYSVKDLAGNTVSSFFNIDLCVSDIENVPNLVNSTDVDTSYDDYVDTAVASYRYWKHFVPLTFDIAPGADLVRYEVVNCEIYDEGAGADYVYSGSDPYYFISTEDESANLVVLIGADEIYSENLDLFCKIDFYGHKDNTYYRRPDTENFTVSLNFDELGIAGPDSVLEDEISTLKDDVKDLEKSMKLREAIQLVLGSICNAAEAIAKVNGVIQAVNDVLFVVFYTWLPSVPEFFGRVVAGPTNEFITEWIWPAGNPWSWFVFANNAGLPLPGTSIKTACWVYNCKFYDAGELVDAWMDNIRQDKLQKIVSDNNAKITEIDSTGVHYGLIMKDFSYNLQTGNTVETTYSYPQGYKLFSQINFDQFMDNTATASSTWIVNPYRSSRLDTLCAPATLFNMQKEKEIKCMKIKCLESAKEAGIGKEVCDNLNNYRECLYLESAMVRVSNGDELSTIINNLPSVFFSLAFNIGTSIAMQAGCSEFYSAVRSGSSEIYGLPQIAACGTAMTLFSAKTIIEGYESTYSNVGSGLGTNPDLGDNCKGIDFDD